MLENNQLSNKFIVAVTNDCVCVVYNHAVGASQGYIIISNGAERLTNKSRSTAAQSMSNIYQFSVPTKNENA